MTRFFSRASVRIKYEIYLNFNIRSKRNISDINGVISVITVNDFQRITAVNSRFHIHYLKKKRLQQLKKRTALTNYILMILFSLFWITNLMTMMYSTEAEHYFHGINVTVVKLPSNWFLQSLRDRDLGIPDWIGMLYKSIANSEEKGIHHWQMLTKTVTWTFGRVWIIGLNT